MTEIDTLAVDRDFVIVMPRKNSLKQLNCISADTPNQTRAQSLEIDGVQLCIGVQPLTPAIHPWMQSWLDKPACLANLIQQFGSPLHLHSTKPMQDNVAAIAKVAADRQLPFQIHYAHKANKCRTYVHVAESCNIGIDVASLTELEDALQAGFQGQSIVYTAAIKQSAAIDRAIDANATIIVDNLDEVSLVQQRANSRNIRKQIYWAVRISGFQLNKSIHQSRFGVDLADALTFCLKARSILRTPDDLATLCGLQFHIHGGSAQDRVASVSQLISLTETLNSHGFDLQWIDMGGGFPVCYLTDESQWHVYLETTHATATPADWLDDSKPYPYWQQLDAPTWLAAVLDTPAHPASHNTLAEALIKSGFQLRAEPGRALLDGCGMTLAEVAFRKQLKCGTWLIGLNMNSSNCRTTERDFGVDPIVLATGDSPRSAPGQGFFVGSYCTEDELVLQRKFDFPAGIAVGDTVAFVNTAGYFMHFLESRAHGGNLPTNLFLDSISANVWLPETPD